MMPRATDQLRTNLLPCGRQSPGELPWGGEPVTVARELRDRPPVRATFVKPKARPAPRANIGRGEEPVRVQGDPISILPWRRLPAKGDDSVSVVVVEEVGERFSSHAKGDVAAAQLTRGRGKHETQLREAREARVFRWRAGQ